MSFVSANVYLTWDASRLPFDMARRGSTVFAGQHAIRLDAIVYDTLNFGCIVSDCIKN